MKAEDINKRISEISIERLDGYQKMFDRILLYSLAANVLPKHQLENTIEFADKVIKRTIDLDAKNRTKFLEETKEGRLAKMTDEPDGEGFRLHYLKTWEFAKEMIKSNLLRPDNSDD